MGRPVLLVHGAWHGPWCWDAWVDRLIDEGHRPMAMALPGHAAPGSDHRIWHRVDDYVSAVEGELRFLGREAVVIGHSMGGLATQRALERVDAALAVLLASVPILGVWGATIRTARRAPVPWVRSSLRASMKELVASPSLTREAFFTEDTDDASVEACDALLQNESYAAYLEMFLTLPRPRRVTTPVRVLAGGRDAIFSVREQQLLARAYRTEVEIFDDAGHDLMLGPWSDQVLDRVVDLIAQA